MNWGRDEVKRGVRGALFFFFFLLFSSFLTENQLLRGLSIYLKLFREGGKGFLLFKSTYLCMGVDWWGDVINDLLMRLGAINGVEGGGDIKKGRNLDRTVGVLVYGVIKTDKTSLRR